ncbi:unnamed protein product [Symbiodinium pilosum]|uniref:Uncharacterized protein n=1 Tax=Symbiodinium pilosum TaxID=2952 RepID=A0A812W6I9_SYMPI|nr:unnamed protein product [Symbiodinium pilosum]
MRNAWARRSKGAPCCGVHIGSASSATGIPSQLLQIDVLGFSRALAKVRMNSLLEVAFYDGSIGFRVSSGFDRIEMGIWPIHNGESN